MQQLMPITHTAAGLLPAAPLQALLSLEALALRDELLTEEQVRLAECIEAAEAAGQQPEVVQQLVQRRQQLAKEQASVLSLRGWAWTMGERVPDELARQVAGLARQILREGGGAGGVQQGGSLIVLETRVKRWQLIEKMLLPAE